MGQFGSGCRPKVLLEALASSSEEVAARLPDHWPLRPDARAVVCPVPNAKFVERSIEPAGVAPATPLRSDCATVHTGLAVEPTQLSHTVFKQHLTSVLLHHMLHETSISKRPMDVGNRAALRTAEVFSWAPWAVVSAAAVSWNSPLLAVRAGRATDAAGESVIRSFWTALVTAS